MGLRRQNIAKILVQYSTCIKPGDKVVIDGPISGLPLIESLFITSLRAGGKTRMVLRHPSEMLLLCRYGNEDQIRHVRPTDLDDLHSTDVYLTVWAEENTREMSQVDPKLQQMRMQARKPFRDLFMELTGSHKLRWCGVEFPTQGTAQEAEMSLLEFEDFVYGACHAESPDPVALWKEVRRRQTALVEYLSDKREIHVIGPDTDITFSVAGRKFINCCGERNMPDGEVFTSPVEDSVNGQVHFTYPACYQGRVVENVTLVFRNGRVVEEHAEKNIDYLREMLNCDEGARVLGEFSFGLNREIQRFSKNILFDEKIGGTTHFAVGAGFPEAGGTNKSALHWDMVCDLRQQGEVQVDGVTVFRDGRFVIDGLREL